jgi:hypothetical protein
MSDKNLRAVLNQLDEEIKNTRSLDQKEVELLHDLDQDIHNLLERLEDDSLHLHSSFKKQLEGALEQFEVTHPNLTALISELLDALSNAGI